jgi:hypothetical protein
MAESEQNPAKDNKPEEKRSKLRLFLFEKRSNKFFIFSGLFFISACLYIQMFINSEPTIDTDYLAQLNQINKPANYKEEDNAWPYYQKAFELYVSTYTAGDVNDIIFSTPPKRYSDLNEHEQKIVLNWIEQNQAAWQELEKASQKTYCYIEYKFRETKDDKNDPFYEYAPKLNAPTIKINFPYLSALKMLAYMGKQQIEIEIEDGNMDKAIEDCMTLLAVRLHWQQGKSLTEEVVGSVCDTFGNEGLLKIISKYELPSIRLQNIQEQLTNIYNSNSTVFDLKNERIVFLDIVQSMFTKGGLGGGHLIPKYLDSLVNNPFGKEIKLTFPQYILYLLFPKYMEYWLESKYEHTIYIQHSEINRMFRNQALCLPISLIHARRNKTIAKYNQIFDQIQAIQKLTPFQIKQTNTSIDLERPDFLNSKIYFDSFMKKSRYFLVGFLTPWVDDNLSKYIFENKTLYGAVITILALKRYKLDTGAYPETLDELLDEDYITSIPMDPYSDKPLVYKKTETEFTLYSVGTDFKDDNGISSLYNSASVVKWGYSYDKNTGDAVFWPIR